MDWNFLRGEGDFDHLTYADLYPGHDDFEEELLAVAALSPDLLIVCLGSNDFIRPNHSMCQLASCLYHSIRLIG